MRIWKPATQSAAGAAAWVVCVATAIAGGMRIGQFFTQPDASIYFEMAAGQPAMLPFAWRQLAPMATAGLSRVFGISFEHGFLLEGILALAVFAALAAVLVVRSGAPGWMLPGTLGLLFWAVEFDALALPDLLYAALLAVFLWLLSQGYVLAAAWMLFPLGLTREATLLVLVCMLAAGWGRLRVWQAISATAATAASMLTVRWLARDSLPNREGLTPVFYLAAKLPWNLLRNVLGIQPWANLYPACQTPAHTMALHLGPLRAIGVCGFSLAIPRDTLGLAMASFGLLPLVLFRGWRTGQRGDLLLRFAGLYGGVSFMLAPLLGDSAHRLFAYGWPLFLVALPLLLGARTAGFWSERAAWGFLTLHLAASWAPWWVYFLHSGDVLAVELPIYLGGWLMLRRLWRDDPASARDSTTFPLPPGCYNQV